MVEPTKEIILVNIEDELKQSYLDYAMSVIIGRALPDVRDGLKPVHRRVLYAINDLNNDWNKAYKKSARVVGDVIGKYHPHGEGAVYDTIVRMAQPFSLRYMLVDGQGNFGSVDGDPPAAMRYTEIRMAKIAHTLLADLDKDTVEFVSNYDETERLPVVLPTRVPNLLINGSSGIAVGMATNIPPHNLNEAIDACLAVIKNPDISVDELLKYIPGPDFPTAGIINGQSGIIQAYKTGRGRIYVRGKVFIETDNESGKQTIIVTELPYQVNKARFVSKIAELVRVRKIEGIIALRDESDKEGMRVVIELRRNEVAEVVLNNLYSQTQLQSVFGINMVALLDGKPKILSLNEILSCFLKHRQEVVSRRIKYELYKARERAHILEGLSISITNIDSIIELIKAVQTPQEAKRDLIGRSWPAGQVADLIANREICRPQGLSKEQYGLHSIEYYLSPIQAQAILDLKLHRLTGLDHNKIIEEFKEIIEKITEYVEILSNKPKLMQLIQEELIAIKEEFGDKRRTAISPTYQDLSIEDLITKENMVVTLSDRGYVKSQVAAIYRSQRRGGRGKVATKVKEKDFISKMLIANTHDTLLCFSNLGKVYWVKVYQLPTTNRFSKGRPMINLLPLFEQEMVSAILPIRNYKENKFIFMATVQGTVKKVLLADFKRPRSSGIIAIDLKKGDRLIGVNVTDGKGEIVLSSNFGKAIKFACNDVRCMSRTARGVRGIKLQPGQEVISLIVLREGGTILSATENGYGKRTLTENFSRIGRGGQGVIAIQTSDRNGKVIGALQADDGDELMLISNKGTLVRIRVAEISVMGRNTQGVILIRLVNGECLVGMQCIGDIEMKMLPNI